MPPFKNRYKQIHDTKSELNSDTYQKQLDLLDRTVGQLVNSIFQILMVGWTLYNLTIEDATDSLNTFVVGFYLYDILYLYMSQNGKTQTMYIIHHALTIALVVYVYYITPGYNTFVNINCMLLEFSSTSINVINIIKFFNPGSNHTVISGINVCIYFLTRVFFYPLNLLLLTYRVYEADIPVKYMYVPPIILLDTLFCVSVWWFIALFKKHKETQRKLSDQSKV
jgi:hypothetical protein